FRWRVVIRVFLLFFFFFQAEDGIRDFHVTGVQTCALPISQAVQGGVGDGAGVAHAHQPDQARLAETAQVAQVGAAVSVDADQDHRDGFGGGGHRVTARGLRRSAGLRSAAATVFTTSTPSAAIVDGKRLPNVGGAGTPCQRQDVQPPMADVVSIDPRTGTPVETVARTTGDAEVAALCRAAAQAAPVLAATSRADRAALLRAVARALEAERAAVVALADRETALGEARLN